jgi:hypothetical protein
VQQALLPVPLGLFGQQGLLLGISPQERFQLLIQPGL